eukprot:TRINITY_DN1691_c0_g1_i2.p1 TRINITY_DN1691_c0_g1~~TRINITY_DN1691_c0_g1_i2.p1  ORF type:complete len:329 (-),score=39.47 TRINITY_DN1691_c0_g1_i2:44-1030(-)
MEKVIAKQPSSRPLILTKIHFNEIPALNISSGNAREGISPYFDIVDFTEQKRHVIYTNERYGEEVRAIPSSQKEYTFDVKRIVRGDILVTFKHVTPLYGVKKMFHFAFHTGMVGETLTLHFHKSNLEGACKDDKYSYTFVVSLLFEPVDEQRKSEQSTSAKLDKLIQMENDERDLLSDFLSRKSDDPTICFFQKNELDLNRDIEEAKELGNPYGGTRIEKGGYIVVMDGGRSWKRKWFVLKSPLNSLNYYKKPRDLKPEGSILLSNIQTLRACSSDRPFSFEIVHSKGTLIVHAECDEEMKQWMKAISAAYERSTVSGSLDSFVMNGE